MCWLYSFYTIDILIDLDTWHYNCVSATYEKRTPLTQAAGVHIRQVVFGMKFTEQWTRGLFHWEVTSVGLTVQHYEQQYETANGCPFDRPSVRDNGRWSNAARQTCPQKATTSDSQYLTHLVGILGFHIFNFTGYLWTLIALIATGQTLHNSLLALRTDHGWYNL